MAKFKVHYTRYFLCQVEGHVVVEAETEEEAETKACMGIILENVEDGDVQDAMDTNPTKAIEYGDVELMGEESDD